MCNYFRTMSKCITGLPVLMLTLCVLTLTAFRASASAVPAPETATGTVLDTYGDPLAGASVVVVGTQKGTSTDADGNFTIPGVELGQTIRISFIGCETQEVKWEGNPISVVLADEGTSLDEVVVVGFGSQKKVNLTGAVSTVSAKELANRPIANVTDALQGLVPGLDVMSSSSGGQLNGTAGMNIRGTGTIGSGSSVVPLVLIDGMEGDISVIAPQDVENISILKDAAASSIYGSRAAGGVILITTKKGKEGKVTVNYSDSFRWSHVTRMPKMMDGYTFAVVMTEAANNNGQQFYTQEGIDQIKAAMSNPSIPTMFPNPANGRWNIWQEAGLSNLAIGNTDWLDEHFGKTAFSQEHNLSINGGTEKLKYFFSANMMDQDGVLRWGDDSRKRYNVTGNASLQLTNWLRFGYTSRWSRNNYDAPSVITTGSAEMYHNFLRYWPTLPTKDPNGYYITQSYIPAMQEGGRYTDNNDRLDQQFTFLIQPIEGLNINAEFNYRSHTQRRKRFVFNTLAYDVEGEPFEELVAGVPNPYVWNATTKSNYFNPNIYADYSRTFNEVHNFKIMAGYQSEWYKQEYEQAQRTAPINNMPWLSTTSGTASVSGGADVWTTAGVFGRINYDYDGRYLVEGNIRYDGSSRFRKGHRWVASPSFSLGWNIARESFWEDFTTVCNTLKLRGSWGILANQNTDSWYPTYSTIGYGTNNYFWITNGELSTSATQPALVSSTLTWEKNRTWDIGLDWGLFNNRLTGSFDYYQRKTMDMVGPAPQLPDILGTSVPKTNNLDMTTKGWELAISWRDRIGEFSYGISANLYDHQTYIDKYPNEEKLLSIGDGFYGPYYDGARLGDIWGYTTVGIAKTQAEMDEHLAKANQSAFGSGWTAGDIMYADLNGDGAVNNGKNTLEDPGDRTIIGNNTPRYQFGLTLDAQWKGFDVKVFFQGVGKRDYWAGGTVMFGACSANQWQADCLTDHMDYFRPADTTSPFGPNVDSYYPRVNWGGGRNTSTQTRYLQNAAYCSLKNVTIGYTLPAALTQKFYVQNLRIYFSGENLAKITNFTGTGDPELIESYRYAYGYGKTYPLQRVFSVGLNVTF